MDTPFASAFLRRLLAHDFRRSYSRRCRALYRPFTTVPQRNRGLYSRRTTSDSQDSFPWQPKTEVLPEDRTAEFRKFPMVTAEILRSKTRRPKRMKMLLRDFIEDSLYNPKYGYFSSHATIFDPGTPFEFNRMQSESDFQRILGERYTAFEDALDATLPEPDHVRQLWHTPTEIFRPHYAEAIARYLVANYKISSIFPYHDLNIYELGAGNGTFMLNVLDYIRDSDPEVYARTRYKIIEISSALASLQTDKLQRTASSRGHTDKVLIINRSVFDWDIYVPEPCFILALEVFDNFAHDAVRYDPLTEEPLQSVVLIDTDGDFYDFYTPIEDPIISRYLRVRDAAATRPFAHPLRGPRLLRRLRANLPLAPNLSVPEYLPTRLLHFFDVLTKFFPDHRLIASDFHALSECVKGINAPVVQTRYQRRMVAVTTPLVYQGYFDILFPTNFEVMEDVYRALTGKLTRVLSHEDFMLRWAYVEDTQTRNGENPLLTFYKNASIMTTV